MDRSFLREMYELYNYLLVVKFIDALHVSKDGFLLSLESIWKVGTLHFFHVAPHTLLHAGHIVSLCFIQLT